jgi:hypothetical protein
MSRSAYGFCRGFAAQSESRACPATGFVVEPQHGTCCPDRGGFNGQRFGLRMPLQSVGRSKPVSTRRSSYAFTARRLFRWSALCAWSLQIEMQFQCCATAIRCVLAEPIAHVWKKFCIRPSGWFNNSFGLDQLTGNNERRKKAPAYPEGIVDLGSRSDLIGLINLVANCAGACSAGNPHATCDVAGIGNGFTVRIVRHSHRKPGANR